MWVSKQQNIEMQEALDSYCTERNLSVDLVNRLKDEGFIELVKNENRYAIKVELKTLTGIHVKDNYRFLNGKWKKSKIKNVELGEWSHWYIFTEDTFTTDKVLLVEGLVDYFSAIETIGTNVAAIASAISLSAFVDEFFQLHPRKTLFIIWDNDDTTTNNISKLFDLPDKYKDKIYDGRAFLWNYKDINEYLIAWRSISVDEILSQSKCIQDYLVSDVFKELQHNLCWKISKYVSLKNMEYSAYQKLESLLKAQMRTTNNFFIIPTKKIVLYDIERFTELEVIRELVCINEHTEQTLKINNEKLVSPTKFDMELAKKNWLRYSGPPKIYRQYLQKIKDSLDYFQDHDLIPIEEIISLIGFHPRDQGIITLGNGDYNTKNKTLTWWPYQIGSISQKTFFYLQDSPDIQKWIALLLDGFGSIFNTKWIGDFIVSFIFAGILKPEVFSVMWCFPSLYIHSQRWVGKSFILEQILYCCGYDTEPDPRISLANISEPWLRVLSNAVNYFLVLDEYWYSWINKLLKESIDSIILANYDWLTATRWDRPGNALGTTTKQYTNMGILIYAGMGIPTMEAIKTRSIILKLSKSDINYLTGGIKEMQENIRKWFFNILQLKHDIDVTVLYAKAEKRISKIIPNKLDFRLQKNLTCLSLLNAYLDFSISDFEQNIIDYASGYDDLIRDNSTWQAIIDDILNNIDKYVSIKRILEEWKNPALYINDNHLMVNLTQIITQYRRENRDFDASIIKEEIKGLLDINNYGKMPAKNYTLCSWKRTKHHGIPVAIVKKNKFLCQIYNTVLEKIKLDIDMLSKEHYIKHDLENILMTFKPGLDTIENIDEVVLWEWENVP